MILKSLPLEKGDLEGFYDQYSVKAHVYLAYDHFTSKVRIEKQDVESKVSRFGGFQG
jgi:hypothetical protein